jgi:hypothetical protein
MILPNPEEILPKSEDIPLYEGGFKYNMIDRDDAKNAMKEYGAQLLRVAAERATVKSEEGYEFDLEFYHVDKESILSIIKEL